MTDSAKVIQVIETFSNKGRGVKGDPVRQVCRFWDLNGGLLTEVDTWPRVEADDLVQEARRLLDINPCAEFTEEAPAMLRRLIEHIESRA